MFELTMAALHVDHDPPVFAEHLQDVPDLSFGSHSKTSSHNNYRYIILYLFVKNFLRLTHIVSRKKSRSGLIQNGTASYGTIFGQFGESKGIRPRHQETFAAKSTSAASSPASPPLAATSANTRRRPSDWPRPRCAAGANPPLPRADGQSRPHHPPQKLFRRPADQRLGQGAAGIVSGHNRADNGILPVLPDIDSDLIAVHVFLPSKRLGKPQFEMGLP
jgi:hypothetical protein